MVTGCVGQAYREHERGREELRAARQLRGAVSLEHLTRTKYRNQKDARLFGRASFCYVGLVGWLDG